MRFNEIIEEAVSPAQQAAIAINMKKRGKKPKHDESIKEDTAPTYGQYLTRYVEGEDDNDTFTLFAGTPYETKFRLVAYNVGGGGYEWGIMKVTRSNKVFPTGDKFVGPLNDDNRSNVVNSNYVEHLKDPNLAKVFADFTSINWNNSKSRNRHDYNADREKFFQTLKNTPIGPEIANVVGIKSKQEKPQPTAPTASPSAKPQPRASTASPSAKPQPQNSQSANQDNGIESYLQKWAADIKGVPSTRPQDKIALAREMINFLKDRRGSPQAARASKQARAVLQNDPNIPAIQKSQILAALPKMEGKVFNYVNQILENVDITWKSIGFTILIESNDYYVVPSNKAKLLIESWK